MQNDRPITISIAGSRTSTEWQQSQILWGAFVVKLGTPTRSPETLAQYLSLSKSEQDRLKDVGGFMGGTLNGSRRKANAVTGRDLVTLDFDSVPAQGTQDILRKVDGIGSGFVVYSTRKHSPLNPRLRIIFPLHRTVTPDEYEPIARRVAEWIGINCADPTTFEASRLMYWPSISRDSEYIYTYADKPFLDADAVLQSYADWHDVTTWPVVPGTAQAVLREVDRQADPESKRGIVGAFCRTYDVPAAIATFIPHAYDQLDDTRYTFTGGSTVGGAVLYDNGKFLFSHHATDPCSGQLVNAWDLVRLHLFGDQDATAKPNTPPAGLQSFKAMRQRALADQKVMALINQEQYAEIMDDFGSEEVVTTGETPAKNWVELLVRNLDGALEKSIENVCIILENDPRFAEKLYRDDFTHAPMVAAPLPWPSATNEYPRKWDDTDRAFLLKAMEKALGFKVQAHLDAATDVVSATHAVHPVRAYLNSLHWDGVPRLDRIFVDYLGALDTEYVRAVSRKAFVAAVARVFEPGIKYDTMLILVGAQGKGKSTVLAKMGGAWFSDSLGSMGDKEAMENIQGKWILEVPELQAMARSEVNAVKSFMTKRDDHFRAAYGHYTATHKRQCVFFGTTNDHDCLRDSTGGRRFWPVDIDLQTRAKNVFTELDGERDQLWAEAMMWWRMGETIYLPADIEVVAAEVQEQHREADPLEAVIVEYVNKPVPENWAKLTIDQRRSYLAGGFVYDGQLVLRDRISAIEVWCEAFGKNKADMRRRDAVEINAALSKLPEWERRSPAPAGPDYGNQKGFHRKS